MDEKHSAAIKAGQARARARDAKIDDLSVLLKTFGLDIVAGYYTKKRNSSFDRDSDFRFRLYHMNRPGRIDYHRDLEELTAAAHKLCNEVSDA